MGIAQTQHCNNDNNDNDGNMMHMTVWIEYFGGLF